jgi:hypothetical protein
VVYKVTRSLQVNQNDRRGYAQDRGQNARPVPEVQNLINRLDSPEPLSIDLNGRSVTIMSSNAPRLVFAPMDGIGPSPVPTAGTMTTHADLYGNELTVTTVAIEGAISRCGSNPFPVACG